MPGGNGKGPPQESSMRGGRMSGTRPGSGPGGNCVCPNCGTKVPHQRGTPCYHLVCPNCGTAMVRE